MSSIRFATSGLGYSFIHAAPIVEDVVVHHHTRSEKSEMRVAVIDTGSDGSRIPIELIHQLALEPTGKGSRESIIDEKGTKAVLLRYFYRVTIQVCGSKVKTEYASAAYDGLIRIGRDVLTQSKLNISWKGKQGGSLELITK